jgi:hypothetical protein
LLDNGEWLYLKVGALMIRGMLSWILNATIALTLSGIFISLFVVNDMGNYFTNENKKWLLGISLPALITLGGWIYVFISSRMHMKKEKLISIKISTYNYIKDSAHDVIKSFNNYNVYTSVLIKELKNYSAWNDVDKRYLIEESKNRTLETLSKDINKCYTEFINSWSQYSIVLHSFNYHREALRLEEIELLTKRYNANRLYA